MATPRGKRPSRRRSKEEEQEPTRTRRRDTKSAGKGWDEWKDRNKDARNKAGNRKRGPAPAWRVRLDQAFRLYTDDVELDDYKDPMDFMPTQVLLRRSAPNDEVWLQYYSAWVGRPVISNSWNGEHDIPDLLYIKWVEELDNDPDKKSQLYARSQWVAEVWVLDHFHAIEKTSAKGNSYTVYRRCVPTTRKSRTKCPHCEAGHPRTFGRKFHMSLFNGQHDALLKELEKYEDLCFNCFDGALEHSGYSCESCKAEFEVNTDSDGLVDEESVEFYEENEIECPECGVAGYAEATWKCVKEVGFGSGLHYEDGCEDPTPGDPWDMVLTLEAVKGGRGSNLVVRDVQPYDKSNFPALDGIDESTPLDLVSLFRFDTLKGQAGALRLKDNEIPIDLDTAQKELDAAISNYKADLIAEASTEEDSDSVPWDEEDEEAEE